ncbi:hypothetical protein FT663_05199 [Candidozyma haemuli var. vulneris]|nr:hypothetical protein FT663_05199 [[Candida] haemuloni var. vulneris]KAF3991249.1 hypothetical protein FT662_01800 [[Candida] haemuloni var. vulneris]
MNLQEVWSETVSSMETFPGFIHDNTSETESEYIEIAQTMDATFLSKESFVPFSERFSERQLIQEGHSIGEAKVYHQEALKLEKYIDEAVCGLRAIGMPEHRVKKIFKELSMYPAKTKHLPKYAANARIIKNTICSSSYYIDGLTMDPSFILKMPKVIQEFKVGVNKWEPLLDTASLKIKFTAIILTLICALVRFDSANSKLYWLNLIMYYHFFQKAFEGPCLVLGDTVYWLFVDLKRRITEWAGTDFLWRRINDDVDLVWEHSDTASLAFIWFVIMVFGASLVSVLCGAVKMMNERMKKTLRKVSGYMFL